ncbi:MAG: restriction endonuclease subunit S [Pirellulales bacterium]
MSGWAQTTLGNVIEFKRGYDLPKRDRQDGFVPIVSSSGVSGVHNAAKVKAPGVVTGRYGTIGEVYFIDEDFWPLNTTLYVRDFKGNDPRFISYFLRSVRFLDYSDKAAVPGINRNHLHQATVRCPPLAEQKAIANILSTLDDKIELNRRMNETLEGMARAIFKSWFVDFDPVRAKADGRHPPGLDPATAALFPDSFEDSPLGKIPKGWKVGMLSDALLLQRGFDLPKAKRRPGPFPVVAASGVNGFHDEFMVKGPGVTTGRSGVLGKVFFTHSDFWPLNTSLWVKEFRMASPTYAFHLLNDLDFETFNAGSAVPTLNRNHVHSLPIVLPSEYLVTEFERHALTLLQRKKANEDDSIAVQCLRDSLLPKLLSGEIHITESEHLVEDLA